MSFLTGKSNSQRQLKVKKMKKDDELQAERDLLTSELNECRYPANQEPNSQ